MTETDDYDKVRELTAKLGGYRKQLGENMSNPDLLTQLSMHIAIDNAELSQYESVFHNKASQTKIQTYLSMRANSVSQGDAEAEGKLAELNDRKFYEAVKALSRSHEKLLASVRARLNYLSEENKRSNVKEGRFS